MTWSPPPDALILVGHSEDPRSDSRWLDGTREWDWCRALAPLVLEELSGMGIRAETRWRGLSQSGTIGLREQIKAINAVNSRCVIELHTDKITDPNITASPMLYWPGSSRGYALACHLADAIGPAYRQRRKVVAQDKSWNGPGPHVDDQGRPAPKGVPLELLRDTVCPAVIAELHYGSHARSCEIGHAEPRRIARAVADGAARWLRGH